MRSHNTEEEEEEVGSGERREMETTTRRRAKPLASPLLLLLWVWARVSAPFVSASTDFPRDGSVIELDGSNFDAAIAYFDLLFVDFYAPWCGHCKNLSPELEAAAPVLAGLKEPIFVAKINADKYRKLASKYEVDGFPTLKLFIHGVPIDFYGPRKADLLVRSLKKLAAPDVSFLESESSIYNFVETAGTDFPIFMGFGLNESVIAEFAGKFKKKAWFAVAKDFPEEVMAVYHFEKVPALVSFHPKYNDQSVFYGPFEGKFLEEFIQRNQLPLAVPINSETIKLLNDDERKIVLTIVDDELDEKSIELVKTLRSAAAANRDLVFGYVGVKQWEEFVDTFDSSKSSKLPTMLLWDGNEEYHLVVGLESLDEEDQASQISRFLEGYREGNTIKKRVSGPSLLGFLKSLVSIRTVYLIVFVVALLMLMQHLSNQSVNDHPQARHSKVEPERVERSTSETESQREGYQPGDKED